MNRLSRIFAGLAATVLLFFALTAPADADTLRRLPRTWLWGPTPTWTNGTTTTPIFFPLSDPMESSGLISVRVSIEMGQDSGNCKMRPALRYSDDGVTWDPAKEIVAAYRTTEGTDYGTTYIDITGLAGTTVRAFVQFGVQVVNEAGAARENCNATIRVEPKEQVR